MTDLATKLNHATWRLAERGRYQQALDLYDDAKLRGFRLSHPDHANCGRFLLCLEKYEEASAQFREANELKDKTPPGNNEGSYLDYQGAAQWLMGRHREAVTAWRYRVSGILSGKVHYADFAGGASDGLLLWYAAVTLKDHELLKYTTEYFRKLSIFGRLSSWPGPLVDMALGAKPAEAILQQHFGDWEFGGWLHRLIGLLRGDGDFLRRRQLVNALFYSAVRHRADGQEQECRKKMAKVVQIGNLWGELEWYLARGELS